MITTVPEFIDPVFMITSSKRSFSITDNEHFGLVFTKTGSINSGTGELGWKRRCFFENMQDLEQNFELLIIQESYLLRFPKTYAKISKIYLFVTGF